MWRFILYHYYLYYYVVTFITHSLYCYMVSIISICITM
jgi:hypothetical protein